MGQDEVTLKDGGTVRGTVVSSEPGVGVKIIELGQSQTRTIPWAQVGDVERGKFAPKGAAVQPGAAGPGYAAPPPPPPPGPPRSAVRLHVDSPKPTMIYAHETAYGAVNGYGFVVDAATPVCSSPCDRVFDAGLGQMFTAGGDGITPSREFTLAGRQPNMELSVEPGSHKLRVAGAWLTYGGVILTVVGGSLALAGALLPSTNTQYNADGTTTQTDAGFGWVLPTGLAIAGGGVAMIIGGIVAIVESKTKIDLHPMGSTGGTAVAPRYWLGEF